MNKKCSLVAERFFTLPTSINIMCWFLFGVFHSRHTPHLGTLATSGAVLDCEGGPGHQGETIGVSASIADTGISEGDRTEARHGLGRLKASGGKKSKRGKWSG